VDVRAPLKRSRAQIFRYPSPVKTGFASSAQIPLAALRRQHRGLGAALLLWLGMLLPLASSVETGPREVPHRRYRRHTERLVGGKAKRCGSWFRLPDTKGGPFSRRAIFSRSNSFSTLTLATTDFNRRFSSPSISDSRFSDCPRHWPGSGLAIR
jgi:hypothetical protein